MNLTRRTALKSGVGAVALGGLAGCLDDIEAEATGFDSGYAAFFTLWDWSQAVAGENTEFQNPVDTGEMGHGWEPEGDLARDIAETDAFVYLDTPEFQWAQDLASTLEADYENVAVIDGFANLTSDDVLDWADDDDHGHDHEDDHGHDDGHDHDDGHGDHDGHGRVAELELIDRSTDEVVADVHGDHWHGGLSALPVDDYLSVGAVFSDSDGNEIPLGDDEEYQLNARVADDADEIVSIESHGDHIHITGEEEGSTEIVFQQYHDDHADWESPALSVTVGEDENGNGSYSLLSDHDHDDGHNHDDDHDDHEHDDGHDDAHDDGHDDHDHDDEHGHDDGLVSELEIVDRDTDEVVADVHGDHWHGGLPDVETDDNLSLGAIFTDDDGEEIPLGDEEDYQFNARLSEGADDIVTIESHGDHIHVTGDAAGSTDIVFQLYHDDHADWESPPLSVTVVDELDDEAEDLGFFDPHLWVDPVHAQTIVSTIADGFAEADPENAETYEANAEAYNEQLEAIDEQFQEMMAEAERSVAVLAGHDSFRYLEDRYDFELHTPVGVSPEAEPSSNDIADTIEFVNENDVDVVLYDHFESPNLAETIVENSDATETAALSPTEGTTAEWNDQGWDYVDQMEQLNLPNLRRAFGAD